MQEIAAFYVSELYDAAIIYKVEKDINFIAPKLTV